jgi:hypothetical protein
MTTQAPFFTTTGGKLAAASGIWLLLGGAAVSFAGNGPQFPMMMLIIAFTGICGFVSAALYMANDYPWQTLKLLAVVPICASLGFPASYLLADGAPLAGVVFLVAAAGVAAVYMKGASVEA